MAEDMTIYYHAGGYCTVYIDREFYGNFDSASEAIHEYLGETKEELE